MKTLDCIFDCLACDTIFGFVRFLTSSRNFGGKRSVLAGKLKDVCWDRADLHWKKIFCCQNFGSKKQLWLKNLRMYRRERADLWPTPEEDSGEEKYQQTLVTFFVLFLFPERNPQPPTFFTARSLKIEQGFQKKQLGKNDMGFAHSFIILS